jgi:hypothetical protein
MGIFNKGRVVMLRTLKKCEWDDIEIGEVFANNDCWEILIKTSEKRCILLASDSDKYEFLDEDGTSVNFVSRRCDTSKLYKLSKPIQSLWKTI